MIEAIAIRNDVGDYEEMILTRPELSGFIVKSVDGLGPSSANINFTELVTIDGAIDNSAKLNTRDLKIDLVFIDNPLIEDTRLKAYKLFPVRKPVTFYVKTDRRQWIHCYGIVEKNEPKIFSSQEGCTITIKCGDPFWHTDEQINTMFYGVDPLFEFPYSNESSETKQVPGNPYDLQSESLIVNKVFRGYQFDADRVHVQLLAGTPNVDSQTGQTYYTFTRVFNSYASRVPEYYFYVQPSSTTNATLWSNNEVGVYCKVEDTEPHNILISSGIHPGHDEYGVYILKVAPMVMNGRGGTALVGDDTEFGNINDLKEGNVFYEGDADTGFIVDIIAKGEAENIQFFDKETGETMLLSDDVIATIVGSKIQQGDTITINTNTGKKSVSFMRDGKTYDILNALVPTEFPDNTKRIEWLKLYKGNNVFGYYATDGLENLVFNVKYDILYEGA